jgi:uncharacterized protein YyaL (SSP411 family)
MHSTFTNRLIDETSPYLLQHAHNPVEWYPWGEEALEKAVVEDKIILVSIGYSACHWCHVMERESFENESVANLMNANFVNIKIDREERPDLDHIYMDAVQAISGSGGWPLNVFLTPQAKPFYGGTYFPPQKAYNRSSWTDVLNSIIQAWKERKNEIEAQAENLTDHLLKANSFGALLNTIDHNNEQELKTIEQCDQMFANIMKTADTRWGGFGKAPKFPQTFTIQYLLRYHYFTGNEEALKQALLSIDKMLMGGIYDHIGGGLARYSTDEEWLAPHFEKMLYDNALLINILCDAYQLSAHKKYADAIRKTISFIQNELLSSEGGFYAALDADSEGEEGKYYVWQKNEVEVILGENAELFCAFFDITEQGNWEEKNILRNLHSIEDFAITRGLDQEQFEKTIQQCLQKLFNQRSNRIKPSLDDKIILSWNTLMLQSIAKAAVVLQEPAYKEMAVTNFIFLKNKFTHSQASLQLMHTYKNGISKYVAFLDDYAYFIAALLQLYKTSFSENYLLLAFDYCNYVIENFSDEESCFFYFTHQDQKDVIVRKKEIYDGATASGNSVMAENLLQLSIIFDNAQWRARSNQMVQTLSNSILKYPGSFGVWASLLLFQVTGINEVVVIGTNYANLSNEILLKYVPNMVMMSSENGNEAFPLLAAKPSSKTENIFLCKNYACLAPFLSAGSLFLEIEKSNKIKSQ